MGIRVRVFALGCVFVWVAASVFGQEKPDANNTSLGDVAREVKAQKAKAPKPVKVFTNDNIPAANGGAIEPGPGSSAKNSAPSPSEAAGTSAPVHDEKYFRTTMGELEGNLNTHQRELDVLQQKLGQNQMQYYASPSQTLQQEYSRGDINKLTADIDAKKQQVTDDQRAIDELRDQLRRDNGDPGWLEGVSPSANNTYTPPASLTEKPGTPEEAAKSREYWEDQFKEAREAVAKAKELQRLAEDELNLLQIQQARELQAPAKADLTAKVEAKQAEVESCKTATANALKALAALEKAFRQSGAPADWGPTE